MNRPWYTKLFATTPEVDQAAVEAKAGHGDVDAQFGLGLVHSNGQPQDFLQAAHWYQLAADQGHDQAQFNLGVMYATGQGVVRDEAVSGGWFLKSAHRGNAAAQFRLGGRQHRASLDALLPELAQEARIEAYKWYQLAAAQGYRGADAARENANLAMSREELVDAEHRVDIFVVEPAKASA